MNTLPQARIRIVGPDKEGGFVVEFYKHTGPKLVFVIPPNADNDVLAYFQERMPYGPRRARHRRWPRRDGRKLTAQHAADAPISAKQARPKRDFSAGLVRSFDSSRTLYPPLRT
jgi:hypothetical protein